MAFGTIIVKDSNGNIRKFDPDFDISQYITREEANQLIQDIPVSLTGINSNFNSETSVITLELSKSDDSSEELTIDLDSLVTTAITNKIEEYNQNNIASIVPSIEDDEIEGLVLNLSITNNNGDTETVSTSFQDLINNILDTLPVYEPATDETDGSSGLVPSATSEQVNSILTGGGWKSIDELGINVNTDLSQSNLECTYEIVKKDFNVRIGFYNGVNFTYITLNESLNAAETVEDQYNIPSTDIIGCSYSYPNNSVVPQSLEERTFEYYQDLECWIGDKQSDHYTITFEDGFTIDTCINEITEDETIIDIVIYGPKANAPRQFLLDVDGNMALYRYNMLDTNLSEYEINAQNISIYQRITPTTQIFDGESLSELEPVLLTDEQYTNDYLPIIIQRSETGIIVLAKQIDISDWPSELASTTLHLVQSSNDEEISTDIDMNCLASYVSSSFAVIDNELNDEKNARITAFNTIMSRLDNIVKEVSVTDTAPSQETTSNLDTNSIILYTESTTEETETNSSNVITVTGNVIDVSKGYYFVKSVTEDVELSFSNASPDKAYTINVLLINGGIHTVTWNNSIIWNNNLAPTLGQNDLLTFSTFDGGLKWLAVQRFSN